MLYGTNRPMAWCLRACVVLGMFFPGGLGGSLVTAEPARDPGRDFDLQGFIDTALSEGKTLVRVPPGRYRVTPRRAQHLVLRDLGDVVIDCTGVEMICTETTRALTIADCKRLTLRGLVIDYDLPPFTQGHITALSPDEKIQDVELLPGYPRAQAARNEKYEVFRPDTRLLRRETPHIEKLEVVDDAHLRLTKAGGGPTDPEEVGDIVVINAVHAPGGFAAHAIDCQGNTAVVLEDVTVYASNRFGFLEHDCEATAYRRCRYDRRPAEADLLVREPRIRSGNADAFHSKHAGRLSRHWPSGTSASGEMPRRRPLSLWEMAGMRVPRTTKNSASTTPPGLRGPS